MHSLLLLRIRKCFMISQIRFSIMFKTCLIGINQTRKSKLLFFPSYIPRKTQVRAATWVWNVFEHLHCSFNEVCQTNPFCYWLIAQVHHQKLKKALDEMSYDLLLQSTTYLLWHFMPLPPPMSKLYVKAYQFVLFSSCHSSHAQHWCYSSLTVVRVSSFKMD